MITFALLAYTEANPLIAMIISSFGQAFNTAPYLCSIPLLISDNTTIGFAWGLWKAMAATSQIIMDTSLGKVQDESPNQSYTNVLTILLAVKALEFGFGILYVLFDHRFAAGILSADEKKRRALESEHGGGREALVRSAGKRTSGLKAYRWSNCWGAIQFGSQILIAWTLFFAFLT